MIATDLKTEPHFREFFAQLKKRSDRLTTYFLIGYFAVGLFLATYYDTWLIAIGVGGLSLLAYYATKWMLPRSDLYQYVLSAVAGIFMAQYIYQMHGMFEMHFFAFIGSAILITHQNWKLQIPLALVVVVHHALFGWLQYIGVSEIFFTQLDYMSLQTFVIHGLLATIIFFLCGLWAYSFKRSSQSHIAQSFEIGKLQEANLQKEALLSMSEVLKTTSARNKDITDSIRYTQRLQKALFPDTSFLRTHFNNAFVFNRPRDIVGGDFYSFHNTTGSPVVACVDCTGHGVPGAFMSIIAIDLLNKIVREHAHETPSVMLEMLDHEMSRSIGLSKEQGVMDGMDMVLCKIDPTKRTIHFAGAMNPLLIASSGGVSVHKGSGFALGGYISPDHKKFETLEIGYNEGDMMYMFSDGYCHQMGGGSNKKLGVKGVVDMVERIHGLPGEEQEAIVARTFDEWKASNDQTDDVMFLGMQLQ